MNHNRGYGDRQNGRMQRSLALMALGATVAVGALCAVSATAYGAQPRSGQAVVTQVAALIVPSGHKPSGYAPSPLQATAGGLVAVAPGHAVTVGSTVNSPPAAGGSGTGDDPNSTTSPNDQTNPAPSTPAQTNGPSADTEHTPTPVPTPTDKSNDGNDLGNKGTGSNKGKGSNNGNDGNSGNSGKGDSGNN